MRKIKRTISLFTSTAIAASAFSAMAVTANAADGKVTFDVDAFPEKTQVVAVKAVYEKDNIKSLSLQQIDVEAGQTKIDVMAEPGTKVMLWNNMKDMKPLDDAKILPAEPIASNPVSINETFGADSAQSPVDGDNYQWGALTIADNTYQNMTAIETGAVSLTVNKGLDLITFNNGVGGADKDIKMSFDGGTVNGFGQSDYTWDLVFKDTFGSEMFRYRYISGGWSKKAGLVVDGVFTQVNFTHTDNKYTNFPIYISFNAEEGGEVTLGDTTLPFAEGRSLGKISIENSGSSDWNRSLVIDNVLIETVAKKTVTLNLQSSESGKSTAGAELVIGNKTYTADKDGVVTAYYLPGTYEYTIKCKEHSVKSGTLTVADSNVAETITLDYIGPSVISSLTIGGGDEYIYLPSSGEAKSSAFTVTAYDNAGLEMSGEAVEWSLPGASAGVSIDENGIITLLPEYALTDDNGVDLTIRATSKSNSSVFADTTIHIHNTARVKTFDIAGPMVVKDGQTATFTVTNVKDQYKNDYTADDTEYSITVEESNVTANGMTITPNVGTSQVKDVELTVTASTNAEATAKKTITVYGYDFYEPGIGQASYGEPRMASIGDNSYIVWPEGGKTTKITFPVPVNLEPGTAKMISFKTAWTIKTVGSQERSIQFANSSNKNVVKLGYNGSVGINPVKVDGNFVFSAEGSYKLGDQGSANTWEETLIILKTDAEGVTTGIASYNGGKAAEFVVGEALNNIASLEMISGSGAPNDRLLGIKDIKISDSNVAEVEISGDEYIAKVEGKTAEKQYKGSVFAVSENETFAWSVTGAEGVTITEDGVLNVSDTVAPETVVTISYTSNINPEKKAEKQVTIKDFANVESFAVSGPAAINAGAAATYKAVNIIDEYGDKVDMNAKYTLTKGADIASIDSQTGVLTTSTDKTGEIEISVEVGNTGKTKTITKTAKIDNYAEVGTTTESSVAVDVTKIADYSADRLYRVTTAKDGVLVNQSEEKATDGKITVDMTGADSYEVSPIYLFENVGNVANGYEIPLADGLYDIIFTKANGTRADIFVNGFMVGQNVDQYGKGRSTTGSSYLAKDVNVSGGSAVVTMKDQTSEMSSIEIKKAPSIVDRKTHVYIFGDSLASTYYGSFKDDDGDGIPAPGDAQSGWGQMFDKFVSSDINVTNLAESGSIAKGLYNAAFPGAIANGKPGDYVIFECGYNDKKYGSVAEMQSYVRKVYEESIEAGLIPVFVTPNASVHDWKESVSLSSGLISVCNELGAKYVDLSKLSFNYYSTTKADPEASKIYTGMNFNVYYSGAIQDNLHSSYLGAMKCAELVAQAIYDMQKTDDELKGLKFNTDISYTLKDSEGSDLVFGIK